MPAGESTQAIVVSEQSGPWKLETVYVDTSSLQDSEVLVDITASGLCHSDLSFVDGTLPREFPTVVGHEGVGTVREVGSSVKNCKKGDKVLLSWAYCQDCRMCKAGLPAKCAQWDAYNQTGRRQQGKVTYTSESGQTISATCLGTSTFARVAIVDESSIVNLGSTKSDPIDLSPLGCGCITGAGAALNVAKITKDSTVAVFGLGMVGSSALMGSKLKSAGTIIAVDLQPSRLENAKKLGATHTINAKDTPDVAQAIKDATNGMGVDYAFECTGVVPVLQQAYDSLATGGAVVILGVPHYTKDFTFNIMGQIRFQKSIIGCIEGDCVPQKLVPELIKEYEAGNFPFGSMCKKYAFKDIQQAVDDMKSGKVVKPILVWD